MRTDQVTEFEEGAEQQRRQHEHGAGLQRQVQVGLPDADMIAHFRIHHLQKLAGCLQHNVNLHRLIKSTLKSINHHFTYTHDDNATPPSRTRY